MSETKVPFDRSKTWPLAAAVLLNLVPVAGVAFWGWSAFALIFLYWMENVVVGVRTILSMFANAALTGWANWPGAVFMAAFFTVHYGLFCFGHGVFVMAMFGEGFYGSSIIDLAGAMRTVFATQDNMYVGLASIVLWQVVQFVIFLLSGEAKRTNVSELMGSPYPRLTELHTSIIFGGFVLMMLNAPVAGVVVLALIKMAYDITGVLRAGPDPLAAAVSANAPGRPQ